METVLVVDDSAVDRRLVGGLLSKLPQIQLEFATNGIEALTKIEELHPTIVITDMVMPGCNGLELVEQIAQRFANIPVVLMTNKGNEDVAVQALKAGAASYVPKSSLSGRLAETVLNVLSLAQQRRTQAMLMSCLVRSEYAFNLGIDDELIAPLISHLQACICASGVCDESQAIRVCIALEEAVRNAMFHGNLEITSEQREGDPLEYKRILEHRRNASPYKERPLFVNVKFTPKEAVFIISDAGPGFDHHQLTDPTEPENLDRIGGRGLLLMRTFMDEVQYNAQGNSVTLIKRALSPVSVK